MATSYPRDRFDTLPDDVIRVGAHRAPADTGRGWLAFAWAALATGVLVGAGVIGLALFTDSINFELPFATAAVSSSPEPTENVPETAAPVLDPAVAITILNGTPTAGLANEVGDALVEEGWGGAAIGIGSRANASATDIAATVVYYSDPANEGAARALVESLGVGGITQSDDFPQSPIVVLVGADYVPPVG